MRTLGNIGLVSLSFLFCDRFDTDNITQSDLVDETLGLFGLGKTLRTD